MATQSLIRDWYLLCWERVVTPWIISASVEFRIALAEHKSHLLALWARCSIFFVVAGVELDNLRNVPKKH